MSELRRARESYQDSRSALCLALADLDNFKDVNDHFGHANGDRVLQLFACRLREACRADDLCCRFGGDEFIVIPRPKMKASNTSADYETPARYSPHFRSGPRN